ncbi:hypothetical protein [Corynebacterium macginleyi]|uniref:hypothetical protein n=1 Tax=Corynebacterium macginleyi TaxID=38290 RepID=UPI001F3E7638|nr:hypothetical protein [Corynebacterium macginleyi]
MESMWPPFGLTIRAGDATHPGVELRVMRDEDIAAIAGVAPEDIYGADIPGYAFPWLFNPGMNAPAAAAQFRWSNRAQLRPEKWSLDFNRARGAFRGNPGHYRCAGGGLR